MKLIFKKTGENVRSYNRSTNGYEFIGTCNSEEEFYNKIINLEDTDSYPNEETGFVYSASGNEVYDPSYPSIFEYGDYNYYLEDSDLDSHSDAEKIRAIEKASPYNLSEILENII